MFLAYGSGQLNYLKLSRHYRPCKTDVAGLNILPNLIEGSCINTINTYLNNSNFQKELEGDWSKRENCCKKDHKFDTRIAYVVGPNVKGLQF